MFDYLILTEKKSAFDNFVAALGGETGTVNGHTYQLTHAQGHLLEFLDPVDQVAPNLKDKYESWELKDLPWNLQDLMNVGRKSRDFSHGMDRPLQAR